MVLYPWLRVASPSNHNLVTLHHLGKVCMRLVAGSGDSAASASCGRATLSFEVVGAKGVSSSSTSLSFRSSLLQEEAESFAFNLGNDNCCGKEAI